MTWLTEAADLLSGGPDHPPCSVGHDHHDTIRVHCDLARHGLHDWPTADLAFDLTVFAQGDPCPGYCIADGDVGRSLALYGCWEGWESVLALALLDGSDGIVLDAGANVGWYSVLAAIRGYEVLAVEADREIAEVCEANLRPFLGAEYAPVARGWIGPDTPMLEPGPRVRLLKADVEGAEAEVMRVCGRLFAAGLIDYVLAEESPCFGPVTWVKTLEDIGFRAYLCPDKGHDIEAFTADPLGYTTAHPGIVGMSHQDNLLLVAPHMQ